MSDNVVPFPGKKTAAQQYKESEFFRPKSQEEVMAWLKIRYEKGFRYVVRDEDSEWLTIYSMKPKRYMDESGWGYREKDFNDIESMPAEIIKNTDISEINWNNKSATDLEKLLGIG
jgi:hypothetical protein